MVFEIVISCGYLPVEASGSLGRQVSVLALVVDGDGR